MSRVGKKPVSIPKNVKVDVKDRVVYVEGPKGKLEHKVPAGIEVSVKEEKVFIENPGDVKMYDPLHGLTRTVIFNLIKGVVEGYSKELEIRGVGFKAQAQGDTLQITLGFSHPVSYKVSEGVTLATPKPTIIKISGIDKVKVGEVASEIRGFFKAEPYTGKGIRYIGEHVRHKAGKTVVK